MFDKLIKYYYDYFIKDGNDGFLLLSSWVCLMITNEMYERFILNKEVPSIETLSIESKSKYWEQAKRFYTDKEQRVKAMKAAYVLELITSTT